MARKALLVCGIVSSLFYVAMNVFLAMQWESYSSASQTVSELSGSALLRESDGLRWVSPTPYLWPHSDGASGYRLVANASCASWLS